MEGGCGCKDLGKGRNEDGEEVGGCLLTGVSVEGTTVMGSRALSWTVEAVARPAKRRVVEVRIFD